mmetsp:Transcript_8551/g.16519  ORF Transcript_8551/g.16519 Transcript_8551/m.16519 type:complete len:107 (-) Transcript_8551:156-476(-)
MERTESTESSSSSSLLSSLLPGIGSSQHYLDYDSDETEFETSLVEGLYTMAFTAHLVAWTVVASVVLTLLMVWSAGWRLARALVWNWILCRWCQKQTSTRTNTQSD